jgi:hypothetical protein
MQATLVSRGRHNTTIQQTVACAKFKPGVT